jgi:tripartite-type tricarboxylate transporter receptor subunit TctC
VNCFDAGRNLGVGPGRPHDHDDARVHARGANVDIVARLIAEQLGKRMGQTIVVEPRPGAGCARRCDHRGHRAGGHAVSAAIYNKLPDAVEDFSFVGMLTDFPFILATYPDHPARTVADVIASAQANEGKLACATAGNGTGMHLAFELSVESVSCAAA